MTLTPRIDNIDTRIDNKDVKNVIINGNFDFWQRGTIFNSPTNAYLADRFRITENTLGAVNVSKNADSPFNGQNCLKVECITNATASGLESLKITQKIEGYNFAPIDGKKGFLSFYVWANYTGTHSVRIGDDSTFSQIKQFTIEQANTWERKIILIDNLNSGGSHDLINGVGLVIDWVLDYGPSLAGFATDTWLNNANAHAGSGQKQFLDTIGNIFKITGVMLTEDTGEPDFEPEFTTAGRNYQEELQLCQRYYEKSYDLNTPPGTVTTNNEGATITLSSTDFRNVTDLKVSKRTIPVMTLYSPVTGNSGVIRVYNSDVGKSASSVGENAFNVVGVGSAVRYVTYQWTADAEL